MSQEVIHEEDLKKNTEKEQAISRSEILRKAREAKKRKNDEIFNQTEHYAKNLEYINAHLTNINSQMTSLVAAVKEAPKKQKIEAPIAVEAPKEDLKKEEIDINSSIISSKYSYILGEALAASLAAGALYYFKNSRSKSASKIIHERYSSIN